MRVTKLAIFIIGLLVVSCNTLDVKYKDLPEGLYADIQTEDGDIIVVLEYENTPVTVANFVSLAEGTNTRVTDSLKGKPFYDGLKFHRVISTANGDNNNFMIQGGDPLANGLGGPGYTFKDEFPQDSLGNLLLRHDAKGILSMANPGKASNGSQFFILLSPKPHLDGKHSVFGHVISGQEVADSLKVNTVINKIVIARVGKVARNFDATNTFADEFKKADKLKVDYLSEMDKYREKAEELPSGLKIYFTKKGEGKKPGIGSDIRVHYEVHFTDGALLDTNYKDVAQEYGTYDARRDKQKGYEPFPSKYSMEAQLVQGFKEGLMQMKFGDQAILFVPSHLAYGEQGRRGIPPNTDLIFKLEMYPKNK